MVLVTQSGFTAVKLVIPRVYSGQLRSTRIARRRWMIARVHRLRIAWAPAPLAHSTLPSGVAAASLCRASDQRSFDQQRAAAVLPIAQRPTLMLAHAMDLAKQIRAIAGRRFAPLTGICGINLLIPGTPVGIWGPSRRFTSDAALSANAGADPIEASSAGRTSHRPNLSGNWRLNAVRDTDLARTHPRSEALAVGPAEGWSNESRSVLDADEMATHVLRRAAAREEPHMPEYQDTAKHRYANHGRGGQGRRLAVRAEAQRLPHAVAGGCPRVQAAVGEFNRASGRLLRSLESVAAGGGSATS